MPANDENALTLLFKAGGQVVLLEGPDEETVWSSDDDEGFQEEFGNEFMDPDDAEHVLEYLLDEDIIDEAEASDIIIESDSLVNGEESENAIGVEARGDDGPIEAELA